jgi:hypothetical protein
LLLGRDSVAFDALLGGDSLSFSRCGGFGRMLLFQVNAFAG